MTPPLQIFSASAPADADLLVILGGPIGVYETDDYPFLTCETRWIKSRHERRQPTLGICLAAQLMAAAMGASVYAGTSRSHARRLQGMEIHSIYLKELSILLERNSIRIMDLHGITMDWSAIPP